MTKRNPEFGGFSACFAVRAETDRKGKATPPARTETAMCEPVDWIYSDFNPLRPRGRRLRSGAHPLNRYFISTHSARKDGDMAQPGTLRALWIFQPTPPARTETRMTEQCYQNLFISTHSAREDGDTALVSTVSFSDNFNPLRPRGRRPTIRSPNPSFRNFNPLRPRGRRRENGNISMPFYLFQPTPPARTET